MAAQLHVFEDRPREIEFEAKSNTFLIAALAATVMGIVVPIPLMCLSPDTYFRALITVMLWKVCWFPVWGWRLMRVMPVGGEPGDFDDEEFDS